MTHAPAASPGSSVRLRPSLVRAGTVFGSAVAVLAAGAAVSLGRPRGRR